MEEIVQLLSQRLVFLEGGLKRQLEEEDEKLQNKKGKKLILKTDKYNVLRNIRQIETTGRANEDHFANSLWHKVDCILAAAKPSELEERYLAMLENVKYFQNTQESIELFRNALSEPTKYKFQNSYISETETLPWIHKYSECLFYIDFYWYHTIPRINFLGREIESYGDIMIEYYAVSKSHIIILTFRENGNGREMIKIECLDVLGFVCYYVLQKCTTILSRPSINQHLDEVFCIGKSIIENNGRYSIFISMSRWHKEFKHWNNFIIKEIPAINRE